MTIDPQRVGIFCGSHPGQDPSFVEIAQEMGRELAARKYSLVFGGGGTGLMGACADAILENQGAAIGVIPTSMVDAQLEHQGLTQLLVVDTMHERKALMVELSGAFIALPGGIGTFEELLEAGTWAQLGIHNKPVGFLNHKGYYDGLLQLLDRAVTEGYLRSDQRKNWLCSDSIPELLNLLEAQPPTKASAFNLKW